MYAIGDDEKRLLYPKDFSDKNPAIITHVHFFLQKEKETFEPDILAGRPTANQKIWFKSPIAKSRFFNHPPTPSLHPSPFLLLLLLLQVPKREEKKLLAPCCAEPEQIA